MPSRPNVVLVVLDTVRRDRVSSYGYERETMPNFDRFAENATRFLEPVAQAPWSIPSHASLFTGEYPRTHGATTAAPICRSRPFLPEQLQQAGYETYAVSPNEYIRPATGFGRGFDAFDPPSRVPSWLAHRSGPLLNWGASTPTVRRPIERVFNAVRTTNARSPGTDPDADDRLGGRGVCAHVEERLTQASEPLFLFVNLMDAHLPRSPAPDHFDRFVDQALADVEVVENERAHTFGERLTDREIEKMAQLYDADVRTLDDALGALLSTLESAGMLENSLVICVSDHGEHLGEFGLVGHQHSVFEPAVSVPLAIQFPDGGPDTISEQVELRRIYHTILDETGVESFPERSLASGVGDEYTRGSFYTPMLDLEKLLWEREAVVEPDLLGERLSFVRDGESKLVEFGDEQWLFGLPEHDSHCLDRNAHETMLPVSN